MESKKQQNHLSFFNGLFRTREAWDAFVFADVSDAAGEVDVDQVLLARVMRKLSPVAIYKWAPATDGDVPIDRVASPAVRVTMSQNDPTSRPRTDRRWWRRHHAGEPPMEQASMCRLATQA